MKKLKQLLVRGHSPPIQILIFKLIYNILNHKTMKTLKLNLLFTLFLTLISNAQITKGNWMVGGDANFTNSEIINDDKIIATGNFIRINPNIGYFFIDKLTAGLNLNFYYNFNAENSNYGYGGGPFLRYYFLKPEKTYNIFGEVNYNYLISQNGESTSSNAYNYKFKVGTVIYFNSSVGLELALNYLSEKATLNSTNNYFIVSLGFQIHLSK